MAWKQITTTPEQVREYIARGAPDWPVTLTRTDGVLTEAVYANGAIRYRQQLHRTAGELTSVLYSRSTDSGATWTDIGTETLNRTDGELTGTSWADA